MSRARGRRLGPRRAVALTAAGVALLLGLNVGTAQASRLDVRAVGTTSSAETRCTDAPVTVSTASTDPTATVEVSGLPTSGACAGAPVEVHLADATGVVAVATGGLTGAVTAPAAFDPTTVRSALVVVGGYGLPTTWQSPQPPEPPDGVLECRVLSPAGSTCTARVESHQVWEYGNGEREVVWTIVATPDGPHVEHLMEITLDTGRYIDWVPRSWEPHWNTALTGCPGQVVTLRNLNGWTWTVFARGFEHEPSNGVCPA